MIRINLLPVRAARKKETLKQQLVVAVVLLVFLLAMLFYSDRTQKGNMKTIRNDIKKNEAEVARLKTVIGEVGKLKARKKELEDKTRVIEKLKSSRSGPVRMMDEVSSIIPQKAWITSLKETGGGLRMDCMAINEEVISDFMINLEKSPYFSDVKLSQITNVKNAKKFGLTVRRVDPQDSGKK